jgi:ribosomal-protein-alanine N-acetyltransferase
MPLSPLTLPDCQDAAQLHQEVFPWAWTGDTFRQFLQDPLVLGFKVEENKVLLGYILWREIGDEAEILTIVVKPSAQQKGIGGFLITALFTHLKEKNISKLFLEVAEDNEKAISFYREHGFSFLSKRPNYYRRKIKPAVSALNFYKKIL